MFFFFFFITISWNFFNVLTFVFQITDPSKLEKVDLSIISDKFDPATNSFSDHLLGWMKGIRSTGTQQTEVIMTFYL